MSETVHIQTLSKPPLMSRLFHYLCLLLLVPSLLLFSFLFVDALRDPFALAAFGTSRWLNLIMPGIPTLLLGALIMRRQPDNVIGPMVMLVGIGWFANTMSASLPAGTIVVVGWFTGMLAWQPLFFIFAYFPNGRIYPERLANWFSGVHILIIVLTFCYVLGQEKFADFGLANLKNIPNPVFVPLLSPFSTLSQTSLFPLLLGVALGGILTLVFRYHTASDDDRNRLRWPLGGASFLMLIFALARFTELFSIPVSKIVTNFFDNSVSFILVITISIAILRHRLYDIDIIIRRTLIYSILSAILAGVYLGTVILVQQLFQSATGNVPDFAIVLSTLLIAGLFTPLRRRVQDVIDRRFYRRKYNVEQTLAQFSQTLRDEVDIEVLKGQLVSVVQDTMQPSSIRLWVKENTPKR